MGMKCLQKLKEYPYPDIFEAAALEYQFESQYFDDLF